MSKTALYRHFDRKGVLLYVGISKNPLNRLGEHSHQSLWFKSIANITIKWHRTRESAEKHEDIAIKKEKPIHNIRGNPDRKVTSVYSVTNRMPGARSNKLTQIPIKLNLITERIIDKIKSKETVEDILFSYSKQYEEFVRFKEQKKYMLGGKRRVVMIPYSGDIYNHLRIIESGVDDFKKTIEALFIMYSHNQ